MSIKAPKFLFAQQGRESSCHLVSWFNLSLLRKLRKTNVNLLNAMTVKRQELWKKTDQWHAVTYQGIVAWQKAMASLTNGSSAFRNYQDELQANAIHFDKIYTKEQKPFWKSSLNPLQNLIRFLFTPYTFINPIDHTDVLFKALPIFSNGNQVYLHDNNQQDFTILTEHPKNKEAPTGFSLIHLPNLKQSFLLNKDQQEYLQLPNEAVLHVDKLKRTESDYTHGYGYMFLPEQAKTNIYYHIGVYQLMLFALGIDQNNNLINDQHLDFKAQQDLKTTMANTPWGFNDFKKENLFEYNLAKIFKENTTLADKAIASINGIHNTFHHYQELDKLYDSNCLDSRQSLKEKKQFLPCKEQILAYAFSMCLRLIWAAAISQKAMQSVMEIPKQLLPLTRLPGFIKAKDVIASALQKDCCGNNVFTVWHEIIEELLANRTEDEMDFVSFNGHGNVISFADDVLSLQSNMKFSHPEIIKELKFAVVDSLYSKSLKPFYQAV